MLLGISDRHVSSCPLALGYPVCFLSFRKCSLSNFPFRTAEFSKFPHIHLAKWSRCLRISDSRLGKDVGVRVGWGGGENNIWNSHISHRWEFSEFLKTNTGLFIEFLGILKLVKKKKVVKNNLPFNRNSIKGRWKINTQRSPK